VEFGVEHLQTAMNNFDEIQFDTFNFCQYLQQDNSLAFMVFKLFTKHDFCNKFFISIRQTFNFAKEINQGYFKENPFHNHFHIIDSL